MALTGNPLEFNQFAVTISFPKDNNNYSNHLVEAHVVVVDFVLRYAFIGAFIVILLMIIALIVKLMWSSDGRVTRGLSHRPTENTTLLPSKGQQIVVTIYGTNDNNESGSNSCSSSQDLYDGKICVICYDDQRNCFFIPCGHCVTCHKCAHRIVKEESKSCPICRGIIYKVKKLSIFTFVPSGWIRTVDALSRAIWKIRRSLLLTKKRYLRIRSAHGVGHVQSKDDYSIAATIEAQRFLHFVHLGKGQTFLYLVKQSVLLAVVVCAGGVEVAIEGEE
ncbi:RING/U-box superfamily protein [Striga asiatica]|uniref:RING/U-box superfamily protein n=1 Tax=Striga asiatica TaxID=4170 RepID=A0A5A7PE28_STRAF|nr:RING/U-box superfamily protein [Striga asiatica]